MIEFGKLYKKDSSPLEEVVDRVPDEIYYTVEGHAVKYISDDEFEFINRSPLVSEELITNLDSKLLKMFWSIHRNEMNLRKVH